MVSVRAQIVSLTVLLVLVLATGSARAATPAPACAPSTLNTSAQLDGSVTVSPLPGSRDATPQTQISFLGVPASELSDVVVSGSRSGRHSGRLAAYSQGDGASFLPAHPFAEGEPVSVRAQLRSGGSAQQLSDQFAIAYQDRLSTTPETIHPGSAERDPELPLAPGSAPAGAERDRAALPRSAPATSSSAPYDGPGQSGPMILDPGGGLIWFKPLPRGTSATNLQVQQYGGRPVLTWWQGDISVHGFGLGEDTIADSAYEDIGHVRAGNGLRADLHDFQLTPQGTALITAYDPIYCDLSAVGGARHGARHRRTAAGDRRAGPASSCSSGRASTTWRSPNPTNWRPTAHDRLAVRLLPHQLDRPRPATAACWSPRATPGRSTTSTA